MGEAQDTRTGASQERADAGRWHFRRMQPGEMNIDPIESEFFSTEALGSLADALVREAVQNSLDARRPGEPLRFRVCFPGPAGVPGDEVPRTFLGELRPHLRANRSGLTSLPDNDEPLSFLAIEDYGTRGLQGDPAQSEDDAIDDLKARRNDFFYFWRNVGRSRKHASDLGRWGLGKTVFQAASRINAFFGLTRRADDGRLLLLGQSVLRIHKLDGHRYYPYGYFGDIRDGFALPIDDRDTLLRFQDEFCLDRGEQPGLSIVIPYPDTEITPDAVAASLIHHYFVPILAGDMSAEVIHGDQSLHLGADSLAERVAAGGSGGAARFERVVELARWAHAVESDNMVTLAPPEVDYAPKWTDEGLDSETLDSLKVRFDAGERVAVTVPVWVKPARAEPILSSFDVFLERDEDLGVAEQSYVRDGITVAGVRTNMPHGIRALVLVRDRALSELLGDSENPAHTEWQERSPKFKNKYRHGPFTLRYVKNAPRELVRLFTRPSEARDLLLLRNVFSLEMPTEETIKNKHKRKEHSVGDSEDETSLNVDSTNRGRFADLQRMQGGFRVKGNLAELPKPNAIAVEVAYDVRRGNPFLHYQPFDFDLGAQPIEVVTSKVRIRRQRNNVLTFEALEPDFQVNVKGFDPHRDIRLRIGLVDPTEPT